MSGVAGKEKVACPSFIFCAGCGARLDRNPVGESSGTRHLDAQADRGPRRRGAPESGQRHAPGETHCLGRTGVGACGPLSV